MEDLQGKIISIARDAHGARAVVDVDAGVICPRCAAGKGCGAGIFGATASARRVEAIFSSDLQFSVGDTVNLTLGSRNLLQASIAASATALSQLSGLADTGAVVAALLGLASGAVLARLRLANKACLTQFVPVVTGYPGASAS